VPEYDPAEDNCPTCESVTKSRTVVDNSYDAGRKRGRDEGYEAGFRDGAVKFRSEQEAYDKGFFDGWDSMENGYQHIDGRDIPRRSENDDESLHWHNGWVHGFFAGRKDIRK
jgi:hypothetical protein